MRQSPWQVGVVIPACDEENNIEGCLAAVRAALAACREVQSTWIVVVADSCSDGTAERARACLMGNGQVIECEAHSPGTARRLGVAALLGKFAPSPLERLWIANTDADSQPTVDWIQQQLRLADRGCAAVAGIVQVESIAELPRDDVAALLEHYVVNEDGSHPHVHGANLGIRADAYVDAGGWGDLALAEDHCLWARLHARNWPTISATSSVVITSGRLVGRATGGFADGLRRRLEMRYA